jgi:hypothetical protein
MKKRMLALTAVLVLSLSGCGKNVQKNTVTELNTSADITSVTSTEENTTTSLMVPETDSDETFFDSLEELNKNNSHSLPEFTDSVYSEGKYSQYENVSTAAYSSPENSECTMSRFSEPVDLSISEDYTPVTLDGSNAKIYVSDNLSISVYKNIEGDGEDALEYAAAVTITGSDGDTGNYLITLTDADLIVFSRIISEFLSAEGTDISDMRLVSAGDAGKVKSDYTDENLNVPMAAGNYALTQGKVQETDGFSYRIDQTDIEYLAEDGRHVYSLEYAYPVIISSDNPDFAYNLNSYIESEILKNSVQTSNIDDLNNTMQEYADALADPDSYSLLVSDDADVYYDDSCTYLFNGSLNGNALFKVTVSDYTGGAHPNYGINYYEFNIDTGKIITLSDIESVDDDTFVSGCTKKIEAVIIKQTESQLGIDDGADYLFEDYKDNIKEMVQDGYWYFSEDGITFSASPYLIAPYAAGELLYTVSYDDLKDIVKSEYIY